MLWIKAFHLIFVVCWFAGIFYLPRLFVYHAMTSNPDTQQHLVLMQQKLYRFTTPFAVLTIFFGGWLAIQNWDYYKTAGWFHAKISLVILLIIYHAICGRLVQTFKANNNQRSHKFYRWFNEAPVLILFACVILAVVKPF